MHQLDLRAWNGRNVCVGGGGGTYTMAAFLYAPLCNSPSAAAMRSATQSDTEMRFFLPSLPRCAVAYQHQHPRA